MKIAVRCARTDTNGGVIKIKLILGMVLEDWRDYCCQYCGVECNPGYRFCYYTDKTDQQGNPLEEIEIEVCKKCCNKLDNNWKSKLK